MKDNPKNDPAKQRSTWKLLVAAAATLAVIQACLTINGRGIAGFILWVLIFFVGYLLLFAFLGWLLQKRRDRAS